jgi:hypothetical protein
MHLVLVFAPISQRIHVLNVVITIAMKRVF